ncbi:MAG: hypothetical protein HY905_27370 [Deltaproteobacteria bacterium]|nr:hypothetical protein [Deltaproteobacteria bacterium]
MILGLLLLPGCRQGARTAADRSPSVPSPDAAAATSGADAAPAPEVPVAARDTVLRGAGEALEPVLVALGDDWLVAWTDDAPGGLRVLATGESASRGGAEPVLLSVESASRVRLAARPDGALAVWLAGGKVQARPLAADARPAGETLTLSRGEAAGPPEVVAAGQGYVVAFLEEGELVGVRVSAAGVAGEVGRWPAGGIRPPDHRSRPGGPPTGSSPAAEPSPPERAAVRLVRPILAARGEEVQANWHGTVWVSDDNQSPGLYSVELRWPPGDAEPTATAVDPVVLAKVWTEAGRFALEDGARTDSRARDLVVRGPDGFARVLLPPPAAGPVRGDLAAAGPELFAAWTSPTIPAVVVARIGATGDPMLDGTGGTPPAADERFAELAERIDLMERQLREGGEADPAALQDFGRMRAELEQQRDAQQRQTVTVVRPVACAAGPDVRAVALAARPDARDAAGVRLALIDRVDGHNVVRLAAVPPPGPVPAFAPPPDPVPVGETRGLYELAGARLPGGPAAVFWTEDQRSEERHLRQLWLADEEAGPRVQEAPAELSVVGRSCVSPAPVVRGDAVLVVFLCCDPGMSYGCLNGDVRVAAVRPGQPPEAATVLAAPSAYSAEAVPALGTDRLALVRTSGDGTWIKLLVRSVAIAADVPPETVTRDLSRAREVEIEPARGYDVGGLWAGYVGATLLVGEGKESSGEPAYRLWRVPDEGDPEVVATLPARPQAMLAAGGSLWALVLRPRGDRADAVLERRDASGQVAGSTTLGHDLDIGSASLAEAGDRIAVLWRDPAADAVYLALVGEGRLLDGPRRLDDPATAETYSLTLALPGATPGRWLALWSDPWDGSYAAHALAVAMP